MAAAVRLVDVSAHTDLCEGGELVSLLHELLVQPRQLLHLLLQRREVCLRHIHICTIIGWRTTAHNELLLRDIAHRTAHAS